MSQDYWQQLLMPTSTTISNEELTQSSEVDEISASVNKSQCHLELLKREHEGNLMIEYVVYLTMQ